MRTFDEMTTVHKLCCIFFFRTYAAKSAKLTTQSSTIFNARAFYLIHFLGHPIKGQLRLYHAWVLSFQSYSIVHHLRLEKEDLSTMNIIYCHIWLSLSSLPLLFKVNHSYLKWSQCTWQPSLHWSIDVDRWWSMYNRVKQSHRMQIAYCDTADFYARIRETDLFLWLVLGHFSLITAVFLSL